MSDQDSYRRILFTSSIMGGAQAVNYIASLLRIKVVALLLGPTGVGIIGLYTSATSLLGGLTGLGLQGSAVRAISQAESQGDRLAVARNIRMLRRLCWATGVVGWLTCIALALPLSRWMFDSDTHGWALAALGGSLLAIAVSNGQLGLLQGLRRIGDIARVQVSAAALNTMVTIGLYAWLREDGIVPVILANAIVTLLASWWFARRIEVAPIEMDWKLALETAKPLLSLGVAMMWSGVLALMLDLYTRTLISREWGVDTAGIYQAAWALSGLFAGFVLGAMGADFYPRLTAVIHDRATAIRAVNEQTEIGILLALPGLLATLAFAKWAVWLLYSREFLTAADALVWMVLGVYGRVLSWPLAFIQLALGRGRSYVLTETIFLMIQGALVYLLVPTLGVLGAAYAFVASYVLYTVGMIWVAYHLIGFLWSRAVVKIMAISGLNIGASLLAHRLLNSAGALFVGLTALSLGSLWCAGALSHRLGADHSLTKFIRRVPWIGRIIGARRG